MTRKDYTFATTVNKGTKKANYIKWDVENITRWNNYSDIYDAYEKPSIYKVRSFNAINERALETDGYNYDLRITGKNSMQYSTIYTFTEDGKTYAVKDTKDNCYITEL